MFEGYKVYKQGNGSNRRNAMLYNPTTGHRLTMSWARYIMTMHLGRLLDKDAETVDHINGDRTDDRIENLRLLPRNENVANHVKTRKKNMVKLVCPSCRKTFVRQRRQTHLGKGGNPTCCSRSCGAKVK